MSLNAQSAFSYIHLIRKKIEFISIKYRLTVHVISIQDGWINEGRQLSEIEIDKDTLHHQYNQIGGQKGGSLSIFITPLKKSKSSTSLWGGLSLKLSGDKLKKSINVHPVYRPPHENKRRLDKYLTEKSNHDIFMEEFKPCLDKIKKDNADTIIMGDLNYDLLETNTYQMCQEYVDS